MTLLWTPIGIPLFLLPYPLPDRWGYPLPPTPYPYYPIPHTTPNPLSPYSPYAGKIGKPNVNDASLFKQREFSEQRC